MKPSPSNPGGQVPTQSRPRDLSLDERYEYLGFEVGDPKAGQLFGSSDEERKLRDHVRDKRDTRDILRDASNFREARMSALERNALMVIFSVMLVSLVLPFTPWISGYVETITEETISPSANSSGKTADGFQAVQGAGTRKRVEKAPYHWSAIGVLGALGTASGAVLSSGIILVIVGALLLIYMALCVIIPALSLKALLTARGDPDEVALNLKHALRLCWAPVMVWGLMLLLSLIGASYGFDTTGALKQLGDSYSVLSFLGLLSSGFYIPLAGFLIAAFKSAEI